MATERFDAVQLAVIAEFVRVLEEPAGGLLRDSGRQLWRQIVHEAIDGLPQDTYTVPRQEFLSIVQACAKREGALEELVRATHLVAPALRASLSPLLDEWRARLTYPGRDWEPLRRALQPGVSGLAPLVSRATGGRAVLPAYCGTPWQAFTHLADRNGTPGGLLPGMVLLEHLSYCPELASGIGEIKEWNDYWARVWDVLDGPGGLRALRAELARLRRTGGRPGGPAAAPGAEGGWGAPPGTAGGGGLEGNGLDAASWRAGEAAGNAVERPVIHLYIKIVPDRTPRHSAARGQTARAARYHVSASVKYTDSDTLHREADAEPQESMTLSQLPEAVSQLLLRMAALWHTRSELVALDFFLPAELLNEPVEWWNRHPGRGYRNPLLSAYRVTLHSLERVQRREFHRAWRARWARWKQAMGEGERSVHLCARSDADRRSDELHLARLDAAIGSDDDVIGMMLCQPPKKHGQLGMKELGLALDLGVPVVIYHREEGVADVCRAAVRETLADEGLVSLPERAQQWKADAAAGRPSAHDPDAIRSLGMIWDDPEHLLDGGPSAPAAFVGGTE
ncbi:effector-associated domain 2-containing protein [Streptomyces sp. PR69]|uniref:VMAP-C domain-containing protein n=1 Tax=Streptomyces sp. PR69 TaxID=2984950 RepID=UPI002264C10C|nr:hypothetical protein [Streptomyces sp. PR69]